MGCGGLSQDRGRGRHPQKPGLVTVPHPKGSHGRLYYGERFTTLKDRKKEIGPGLYRKMLRDLGIEEEM